MFKLKELKLLPIKYSKIEIKPLKGIDNIIKIDKVTDTDGDGVPNYKDCEIFNPRMQGLYHILKGRKAKKKLKVAEKLDLPIEEEEKKKLEKDVEIGDTEKEKVKSRLKQEAKQIDKGFRKSADAYSKKMDEEPSKRKPIYNKKLKVSSLHPMQSRHHPQYERAVVFGINDIYAYKKLHGDSSLPDMSYQEKVFYPPVTGTVFTPNIVSSRYSGHKFTPPIHYSPLRKQQIARDKVREMIRRYPEYFQKNPKQIEEFRQSILISLSRGRR